MNMAANDNANDGIPTVTKVGSTIEYRNLKRRDGRHMGRAYEGEVKVGQHADVTPGKSIRLHGLDTNKWEPKPHDITFKVGDRAVHGAYNLVYTGVIVSIGAKTVTVEDGGERKRMSIFDFNNYNHDYDAERIAHRNREMFMTI